MNKHRDLKAWQACRRLASAVYRATRDFPPHERFGLTAQMRRAAVSAAANIAEGNARMGAKELGHGLSMSLGSLAELDTLTAIAQDLGYLDLRAVEWLEEHRVSASQLTFALQKKVRSSVRAPAR